MTTIRIGAVRFKVYPQDHRPRHVHGLYQGIEVILNLQRATVTLADRRTAVEPGNAKRNQVRYVLDIAADNFDALLEAREAMQG